MSKELEQLRLNMMTSMMELDQKSLEKVKQFMENQESIGWKEHFNNNEIDFINVKNINKSTKRSIEKPSIVFL